jgi:hypothetical protein
MTNSSLQRWPASIVSSAHATTLRLEILALRQQLAVFERRHPRPQLKRRDRLFWVALSAIWDGWRGTLILVKPETVVGWHRAGFRLYWRFRSLVSRLGRRNIDGQVCEAIKRMTPENPSWGAPRIHGELLKLGFGVSERTVADGVLANHSKQKARRKGRPQRPTLIRPGELPA